MRRLYSARAGRLIAQPVRWQSTADSLQKPAQDPGDLDLTPKPRADGHPSPRPRPGIDDSSSYTPNIGVLAATAAAGSLSSRLALERLKATAQKIASATSPDATPKLEQPSTESPEVLLERRRELLASRRDERLARNAASDVAQTAPLPVEPDVLAPSFSSLNLSREDPEAAMARRRNILLARRAERLARETTAPTQQRYAQPRLPNHAHASGSNVTERRPTIDDPAARDGGPSPPSRGAPRSRGETNMRGGTRGGRGGTRGGRGRGRGRGRGGDSERPERSNEDGEGVPEIDDWLTSDEIHVASYTEPEIGMGDLNLLPHDTPAPLKFLSAQARRESLGGDYSRFIPTNPQLFISAAKKLGPTKHSSVVMAHNEHLPITDRTHVQELVGSVGRQG